MRFNQNNLRKRKRESIEFEGIQFNDKKEWINREIDWSPKYYYEYDDLDNFIWNEIMKDKLYHLIILNLLILIIKI